MKFLVEWTRNQNMTPRPPIRDVGASVFYTLKEGINVNS